MKKLKTPAILSAGILIFSFAAACTTAPSADEIKAAMEIVDVETKWVSKAYHPWPPKLILVPVISFRVKNVSGKPLTYINFNAIFKIQDMNENLGDNFLAAIRKEPVLPGSLSEVITLKSNFGVEGKSLASFKDNPQWKPVLVKLFAQTKGSIHVSVGEWQVSRDIDFKEPEPVGLEKKEEKKNE